MSQTPVDLYAFGSKANGPRLPRPGKDLFLDDEGMIGAEDVASAQGASTFADLSKCELTGHYFRLVAGTELPQGLGVVADGQDVRPTSEHAATHHTIFPNESMPWQRFVELFQRLPWQYAGKKS